MISDTPEGGRPSRPRRNAMIPKSRTTAPTSATTTTSRPRNPPSGSASSVSTLSPSSASSAKKKRGATKTTPVPASVYLRKLSTSSLAKYQKQYRLRGKNDASDLLKAIVRHFEAQNVEEMDVIQNFLFALHKTSSAS